VKRTEIEKKIREAIDKMKAQYGLRPDKEHPEE